MSRFIGLCVAAALAIPLPARADVIQTNFYEECLFCGTALGPVGTASVSVENGTAVFNFSENLGGYDWKILGVHFNVSSALNSSAFVVSSNSPLGLIYGPGGSDQFGYFVNFDIPLGTPIPSQSIDLLPTSLSFSISGLPSSATASDFFISNPLFSNEDLTAEFELVILADNNGTSEGSSIASNTNAPSSPPSGGGGNGGGGSGGGGNAPVPEPATWMIFTTALLGWFRWRNRTPGA